MEINIYIHDKLYKEINEFCHVNDLKIDVYINELIENGFYTEKYGDINILLKKEQKITDTPLEKPIENKVFEMKPQDIKKDSEKKIINEEVKVVNKINRTRRTIKAK